MLKERSYLEKSALQAMTFLIAKTISNKVWGLCLPRKLARVSFSREKKLKAALIGSLMGAILLRVWRNLSRQFASRFLLSTKILVLATSSSFYLFEKSSARGLQSIQKSYWGSQLRQTKLTSFFSFRILFNDSDDCVHNGFLVVKPSLK